MQKLEKFGITFYKKELKNGVNLFLFKRKGMPIYLRATFFAGSRFDSIPGTAHFLEHMLLAGTKTFPTKNMIAEYIQKTGGDFGASTNNNIFRFNVEIPDVEDIDIGIKIMSECLTKSIFDDQTLETERMAIMSELKSKKNNPREYIWDVQRRIALQGTQAGRSTLGDEISIKNITKDDLINYQKKFINSGRVSFIASGDISIEKLAEKLESIDLDFGDKFVIEKRLPIIKERMVEVELYKNINHLQIVLVCRTSLKDYREYCALMVLNSILSEGRGSRLITKLRYENGLVYSVTSSVFNTIDWGTFKINFSCDKHNFERVKSIIYKEFEKLRQKNISSTELENTKSKMTKGSIRYFQTSNSWVNFHEDNALFAPANLYTAQDYIKTVNSLTLKDIKKVIDEYLLEDNFYTAICGDYKI